MKVTKTNTHTHTHTTDRLHYTAIKAVGNKYVGTPYRRAERYAGCVA